MFEALNPLYWWGALAISAPIIIHLINRLRYRRVRWAAMEFLLKSQERNRRKILIEQLILLALRCALIMLVVMLVVRPTWLLGGDGGRTADWPTFHVVLLDDGMSMQDVENPRAADSPTVFQSGQRLIGELARKYSEAQNTHYLTVLRLSDLDHPVIGKSLEQLAGAPPGQQLTADEARKIKDQVDLLTCTYLPLQPLKGLQAASRYFENVKEGNKVLHVVSDYRRQDWTEAGADEACQLLAELARGNKVQIRLHDLVPPPRGANKQEAPAGHPNLGIIDLSVRSLPKTDDGRRAEAAPPARIVTPNVPIYLYVTLRNFSSAERAQVAVTVKVNGRERTSRTIDRIPGGEDKTIALDVSFGPDEEFGFKQISVNVADPSVPDHLAADNVRHAYVDLRKDVPVLIVDPDLRASDVDPDSFYLRKAFTGTVRTGLRPEVIAPSELKNRSLDSYAVVFLTNLAGVGDGIADVDATGLVALEKYVARGGSAVFFLGPRTNVVSFNKDLYRNGQGIFPMPLLERPDVEKGNNQPFVDDPPDEEDVGMKLRYLKPNHPVFVANSAPAQMTSQYVSVNRYFKVDPKWQPGDTAATIVQLANRKPLTSYRTEALDLAKEVNAAGGSRFERIRELTKQIEDWMQAAEGRRARKGPLIDAIAALPSDPTLAPFWADEARTELKKKLTKFHETLVTGDPLVVEATVANRGHVVVFTTPAAPTPIQRKDYDWNNWANEVGFTFVPTMLTLHDYLARLSRAATDIDTNRLLGTPMELRLDKERYVPRVELWHQKEGDANPTRVDVINAIEDKNQLVARIRPLKGPGHYVLKLNPPGTEGNPEAPTNAKGEPEDWPLVFNVDGRVEGNLARVAESEVLERLATGLEKGQMKMARDETLAYVQGHTWFTTSADAVAQETIRNRSWSDYSWVLLVFLGVLSLECFLASVFSHHSKGGMAMPSSAAPGRVVRPPVPTTERSDAVGIQA